jgi:hypothetical protein
MTYSTDFRRKVLEVKEVGVTQLNAGYIKGFVDKL